MAGHIMATNWVTKAKVTWAKQLVSWLLLNVFDTIAGHILVTKWVIEAKVTGVKRLFCRDAASHYPLPGDHEGGSGLQSRGIKAHEVRSCSRHRHKEVSPLEEIVFLSNSDRFTQLTKLRDKY